MTAKVSQLVGTWQRISTAECSQLYPAMLQLQENKLYEGQSSPGREFTIWDVGEYEIISDHEIKISTANDAILLYQYSISSELLTFVDSDNCKFQYRKVS